MSGYKDISKRIWVDIDNERPYDSDIVGVTRQEFAIDFNNNHIPLNEGDYIYMYTESIENGILSYIVCEGYVISNPYKDMPYSWCCKIVGDIEYIEDYNQKFDINS